MGGLMFGNDDDGYDHDDPKSSSWGRSNLELGARLQRIYENQENDQ